MLAALKLFEQTIPEAQSLIALVDYTGEEITDSLRCAEWFYKEAKLDKKGKVFGVRLDRAPDAAVKDFIDSHRPPEDDRHFRRRGAKSRRNRAHRRMFDWGRD